MVVFTAHAHTGYLCTSCSGEMTAIGHAQGASVNEVNPISAVAVYCGSNGGKSSSYAEKAQGMMY